MPGCTGTESWAPAAPSAPAPPAPSAPVGSGYFKGAVMTPLPSAPPPSAPGSAEAEIPLSWEALGTIKTELRAASPELGGDWATRRALEIKYGSHFGEVGKAFPGQPVIGWQPGMKGQSFEEYIAGGGVVPPDYGPSYEATRAKAEVVIPTPPSLGVVVAPIPLVGGSIIGGLGGLVPPVTPPVTPPTGGVVKIVPPVAPRPLPMISVPPPSPTVPVGGGIIGGLPAVAKEFAGTAPPSPGLAEIGDWWTKPVEALVSPPGTVPPTAEKPFAMLGGKLGYLGGTYRGGEATKWAGAPEAFEKPTPGFLAEGFMVGPGAAIALATTPLLPSGLVGLGFTGAKRVIETGAVVGATTGVAAVGVGAGTPPPEVPVGAYEAVTGVSTVGEIEVAGTEAKDLEIQVGRAQTAYEGAGSRAERAQAALDAKWSSFLTAGGELKVSDAQYAQYQKEYESIGNLIAKASALGETYKGIYGKYEKAYKGYEKLSGSLVAAQARVGEYVDPLTDKIDIGEMQDVLGKIGATTLLASAGYKPTIDRGIWNQLSLEAQKAYTPTKYVGLEYQVGVAGAYGRGTGKLYQPTVDWLTGKGLAGQLGAGMFQYLVPHTLVTEQYPGLGPLSTVSLAPHLGSTAGYATITSPLVTGEEWSGRAIANIAMGYGFAALPYAVGPLGTVGGKVGGVISKVPVLGPVAKGIGKVIAEPFKWGAEVVRPLHMEAWAPWRAAYEVSGLAGKAGLARVPRLGPAGAKWGWWSPKEVPVGLMPKRYGEVGFEEWTSLGKGAEAKLAGQRIVARAPEMQVRTYRGETFVKRISSEFKRFDIDIAEVMKGPKTLTGRALEEALYGKTPQVPGPRPYRWSGGEPSAYPWTGYGVKGGIKPAIVQQVGMPSGWSQLTQFARTVAPRVAIVGGLAAPMFGAAFLPMVAPTMFPQAADMSVLGKTDVATAAQMLAQGQITQVQHDQIVQQVQSVQEVSATPEQYQEQIQTVVQEQLDTQQQEQYREQIQETVQDQQQQVQREIVQQRQVLEQMQEQEVAQWQVDQQQEIVQQLRTDYMQYNWYNQIVQQEFPGTPPTPPTPLLIPPLVPFLPPGAGVGRGGFARGFRAGRLRYGKVMWPFPELIISMPAPFTGVRKTKVIRKAGRLPYGGRAPSVRMGRAKGIRV